MRPSSDARLGDTWHDTHPRFTAVATDAARYCQRFWYVQDAYLYLNPKWCQLFLVQTFRPLHVLTTGLPIEINTLEWYYLFSTNTSCHEAPCKLGIAWGIVLSWNNPLWKHWTWYPLLLCLTVLFEHQVLIQATPILQVAYLKRPPVDLGCSFQPNKSTAQKHKLCFAEKEVALLRSIG